MFCDLFLIISILPAFFYFFFLLLIKAGLKKIKKGSNHFENAEPFLPSVSLIIPFRNEKTNLPTIARLVQNFDYPEDKLEIIFVDDFSEDDSVDMLKNLITRKNVKVISSLERKISKQGKKAAITEGVNLSTNEIIVTVDADCFFEKNWLRKMISRFDEGTALVSGPVEFVSDGTFFNEILKLEFSSLILSGAGLIGIKFPVICNGANLAYRKKAFLEVGGFSDNFQLSSGDDDILLQKLAKLKYKIQFCWDKEAIVKTYPPATIREFFHQRRRWASKGLKYPFIEIKILLILIFLFYLSLFVMPILYFLCGSIFLFLLISFFVFKAFLELSVLKEGNDLFEQKTNFIHFAIAEIFHPFYILFSSIFGTYGNFEWKNRKLKR